MNSIYKDVGTAKKFIKWYIIIGLCVATVVVIIPMAIFFFNSFSNEECKYHFDFEE